MAIPPRSLVSRECVLIRSNQLTLSAYLEAFFSLLIIHSNFRRFVFGRVSMVLIRRTFDLTMWLWLSQTREAPRVVASSSNKSRVRPWCQVWSGARWWARDRETIWSRSSYDLWLESCSALPLASRMCWQSKKRESERKAFYHLKAINNGAELASVDRTGRRSNKQRHEACLAWEAGNCGGQIIHSDV